MKEVVSGFRYQVSTRQLMEMIAAFFGAPSDAVEDLRPIKVVDYDFEFKSSVRLEWPKNRPGKKEN